MAERNPLEEGEEGFNVFFDLSPGWGIRLTVTFRPEAAFRPNYNVQ